MMRTIRVVATLSMLAMPLHGFGQQDKPSTAEETKKLVAQLKDEIAKQKAEAEKAAAILKELLAKEAAAARKAAVDQKETLEKAAAAEKAALEKDVVARKAAAEKAATAAYRKAADVAEQFAREQKAQATKAFADAMAQADAEKKKTAVKEAAGRFKVELELGTEAKLKELEAKLQALLKEIQALRGGSSSVAPAGGKARVVELERKVDAKGSAAAGEHRAIVLEADGKKVNLDELKKKLSGDKNVDIDVILKHVGKELPPDVLLKLGDKAPKIDMFRELKDARLHVGGLKVDPNTKEMRVVVVGEESKDAKGGQKGEKKEMKVVVVADDEKGTKAGGKDKETKTAAAQVRLAVAPQTGEIRALAVAGAAGGDTLTLTRSTYQLSPDRAKALDAFLKDHIKTKVLETKLEGEKLTVTTTPDVQHVISGVVGLMAGKDTVRVRTILTKPAEAPKKP